MYATVAKFELAIVTPLAPSLPRDGGVGRGLESRALVLQFHGRG